MPREWFRQCRSVWGFRFFGITTRCPLGCGSCQVGRSVSRSVVPPAPNCCRHCLFQAGLKYELRVDEAGEPLPLWIYHAPEPMIQ